MRRTFRRKMSITACQVPEFLPWSEQSMFENQKSEIKPHLSLLLPRQLALHTQQLAFESPSYYLLTVCLLQSHTVKDQQPYCFRNILHFQGENGKSREELFRNKNLHITGQDYMCSAGCCGISSGSKPKRYTSILTTLMLCSCCQGSAVAEKG